jgi:hypothetical protein
MEKHTNMPKVDNKESVKTAGQLEMKLFKLLLSKRLIK